jgi:hypothetical protein
VSLTPCPVPSNIHYSAINKHFLATEATFAGTSSIALSQLFSNVKNDVFTMFNSKFTHTIGEAQRSIYTIGNSTFNSTDQLRQTSTLFAVIQDSIFSDFGIEPPEVQMTANQDLNDEWNKNMSVFMLVVCPILPPCAGNSYP